MIMSLVLSHWALVFTDQHYYKMILVLVVMTMNFMNYGGPPKF